MSEPTALEILMPFLKEKGVFNSILLEPQKQFNQCIVGYDEETQQVIYSYSKIVDTFVELYQSNDPSKSDDEAYTEACEWVEYNTIRALPYMGKYKPIIRIG